MANMTVAIYRNYPKGNGVTAARKKLVLTTGNLSKEQVAAELKKRDVFKAMTIEQMVENIEIVGDETSLSPADRRKLHEIGNANAEVVSRREMEEAREEGE